MYSFVWKLILSLGLDGFAGKIKMAACVFSTKKFSRAAQQFLCCSFVYDNISVRLYKSMCMNKEWTSLKKDVYLFREILRVFI